MLCGLNWLREFTPYEGEAQALADRLTMLGLEVDEISDPFGHLAGVVVGHVIECGPHPDADKLSVTRVDVGAGVLDIVCGAPNVAQGQKVAVAPVGTVLPGGIKLKKAKIRGAASHGMIVSEKELGISDDHTGIMVLDDSLAPGTSFPEALNLERTVLSIDLTPNRGDCLSILGLAREVAMAFGLPFRRPSFALREGEGDAREALRIEIADPELCPLYQARIIRGVKVGPSPLDIKCRLLSVGVRPISNIVDVTNYVMMEMGQPLHAFDEDLLRGGVIRVAPAEDGMELTTLDGQTRKLLSSDLLIWDGERPVALAGVMGGEDTEIHSGSTNVALECAVFNPSSIRRTARRLALPSEASHRFERGVDQVLSHEAVDRAAQLMAELAGGTVLRGVSLAEPRPWVQPEVSFRPTKASAVVGIEFKDSFCETTLTGLGCEIQQGGEGWSVRIPPHRPDLEREIDLVEEVARVYGLDRIPATLPVVKKPMEASEESAEYDFLSRLKHWARGVGLRECVAYSFVGTADLDLLGEPQEDRVAIANPLSEDQCVLRTSVPVGLVQALGVNLSHGNPDVRLFEVARTFHRDDTSDTTAREENRLAILLHGARFQGGYPWPAETSDYADVKGLVEDLCRHLGLSAPLFELEEESGPAWLAPCVRVSVDGQCVGSVGKARNRVAAEVKARADIWMADLSADTLRGLAKDRVVTFRELPKYPPIRRDVTFVTPVKLPVAAVVETALGAGEALLAEVRLIDDFRPEGGETRNLTYRMTYRSPSKTLTDKEADKVHARLVGRISEALPVTLQ